MNQSSGSMKKTPVHPFKAAFENLMRWISKGAEKVPVCKD